MSGYLLVAVAGYVLFGAALFTFQRHLLYYPDQTVPRPADYGLDDVEPRRIPTADGLELYAWWRAPAQPENPVIVYFHGNAGHIGYRAQKIRPYLAAGYGVLLVGYRYNAGAGGAPSEAGLYEDGRAAFRYLSDLGVRTGQAVVYGESLGSGVAVTMALEHDVAAIVLESPYTSIAAVAQSHYWYLPAKWLVRDKFDLTDKIRRLRAPLLVVHGEEDRIIPARFGRALFDLAPPPKDAVFIPGGGHNDLPEHGLAGHVIEFLTRQSEVRLSR